MRTKQAMPINDVTVKTDMYDMYDMRKEETDMNAEMYEDKKRDMLASLCADDDDDKTENSLIDRLCGFICANRLLEEPNSLIEEDPSLSPFGKPSDVLYEDEIQRLARKAEGTGLDLQCLLMKICEYILWTSPDEFRRRIGDIEYLRKKQAQEEARIRSLFARPYGEDRDQTNNDTTDDDIPF